jgi:hypothetical protein
MNSAHGPVPGGSLSAKLHDITQHLPPEGMDVAELMRRLGQEGLLLFSVLLCLPFLLPVQIPGVSTVFGAAILLIGIAVLFNMQPWLPGKVARYRLAKERLREILVRSEHWVTRLENLTRPRMGWLTQGWMGRLAGGWLALAAALLMLPLAIIPFSNTLPALAIMFLAVGAVEGDGLCLLIGLGFIGLSIVYFGVIFTLGVNVVLQAMPFLNFLN